MTQLYGFDIEGSWSMEDPDTYGYVYKITSPSTDLVYVGSTTESLKRRLSRHKSDYKRYLKGKYHYVTSFEIVKHGDAEISLLEEVLVEDEDPNRLHRAEAWWITDLGACNKQKPGALASAGGVKAYHKAINKIRCQTKIVCVCGGRYGGTSKTHHLRTAKHQRYLDSLPEDLETDDDQISDDDHTDDEEISDVEELDEEQKQSVWKRWQRIARKLGKDF